jgi:hypothetical protein
LTKINRVLAIVYPNEEDPNPVLDLVLPREGLAAVAQKPTR